MSDLASRLRAVGFAGLADVATEIDHPRRGFKGFPGHRPLAEQRRLMRQTLDWVAIFAAKADQLEAENATLRASVDRLTTQPAWPEWLSAEYSAVHQIIRNEQERALEHCEASADAAGMGWTKDGLRSVTASNIMAKLRRLGFQWPTQPVTPEEPYEYVPDPLLNDDGDEGYAHQYEIERDEQGAPAGSRLVYCSEVDDVADCPHRGAVGEVLS